MAEGAARQARHQTNDGVFWTRETVTLHGAGSRGDPLRGPAHCRTPAAASQRSSCSPTTASGSPRTRVTRGGLAWAAPEGAGLDAPARHRASDTPTPPPWSTPRGLPLPGLGSMALSADTSRPPMSLRLAGCSTAPSRTRGERALDLAKSHIGPMPATGLTAADHRCHRRPTGRMHRPSNHGSPAATASEHPRKVRAPTPTSASTAPAFTPTRPTSQSSPPNASTPKIWPQTPKQRGWIDEADRHRKLIARLDALIAQSEPA